MMSTVMRASVCAHDGPHSSCGATAPQGYIFAIRPPLFCTTQPEPAARDSFLQKFL